MEFTADVSDHILCKFY